MKEVKKPSVNNLLVEYIKTPLFILTAFFTIYNYDSYQTSDWFVLGIFLMVAGIIPWAMFKAGKESKQFIMGSTLAKYICDHPDHISHNNRVSCYECSGNRIFVRKSKELSQMQEHVCSQCGKTLYYSKRSSSFDSMASDD